MEGNGLSSLADIEPTGCRIRCVKEEIAWLTGDKLHLFGNRLAFSLALLYRF